MTTFTFSAVSIQCTLLHTPPVPQTSNRKSTEIIINQLLTLFLRKKVGVKTCILPKNVVSLHRQSKEQPFVPRSGLLLRPARVINDGRRRSSMKPRGSKVKRSARSLRSRSLRSLRKWDSVILSYSIYKYYLYIYYRENIFSRKS